MSETRQPDWADEAAVNIVDVWVVPSTGYANAPALKERFAKRLRDEREACAKVAETFRPESHPYITMQQEDTQDLVNEIIHAIRNREAAP